MKDLVTQAKIVSEYKSIRVDIPAEIAHVPFEAYYAIRKADWKRLQRAITNLPIVSRRLSDWSFLFLGFALAIIPAVLPLFGASSVEQWKIIALLAACVTSFVLALAFKMMERIFVKERKAAVAEIVTDMDEIVTALQSNGFPIETN